MKQTIKLNERELHNLISESVKRVLNESTEEEDFTAIRSLYDMICKWQDANEGKGPKSQAAWNYMDKEVRPNLDNIMFG